MSSGMALKLINATRAISMSPNILGNAQEKYIMARTHDYRVQFTQGQTVMVISSLICLIEDEWKQILYNKYVTVN